MVCYSLRVGPPEPTNPREKCNVLDVFMRCVLEVFERVLAIYSTVLKVFYTFLECLELGPGINVTRNT